MESIHRRHRADLYRKNAKDSDADTRQILSAAIRKSYARELRQVMGK